MPKKRSKPRPHIEPRSRNSSSLKDHRRTGKQLQPPMTALMGDTLKPVTWWRDYLPNYLWLCWQVSSGEYQDVFFASRLMDEIVAGIGDDLEDFPEDWAFTGRLSDFETIPASARGRLLNHLIETGAYGKVVPKELAHALGMYPDAPGRWIIDPWLKDGMSIDPAIAERELSLVIAKSIDGRDDTATRAKALFFRQKLIAGKLFFSSDGLSEETFASIRGYPKQSEELNARAESMIRAMFLAIEGIDDQPTGWAQNFWRSNWSLFTCLASAEEPGPNTIRGDTEEARAEVSLLRQRVESTWKEFVQLASTTDPDLYSPHRFEVLTGITARALRLVRIFAEYPPMWTMEHGAPVLRALVESRITANWLSLRDDATLYAKFKSYGVGKLKLYKLHLEEFIDGAGEDAGGMQAHLDRVTAYVNRDTMEEYIDIDLGGNFSGSDMRKMADEVHLGSDYRLLFAHASSNVHGEWGSLDMNVFETCLNPLHGMHRIVRDGDVSVIGADFIEDVLSYAEDLLADYKIQVSGSEVAE